MLSEGFLEKMKELRRRVEMGCWDQVSLRPADFVEMVDELEIRRANDKARAAYNAGLGAVLQEQQAVESLGGTNPGLPLKFSGWRSPEPSVFDEIRVELEKAAQHHGGHFSSLHEAYGVLLEEVDEDWEIVKQKESGRDLAHLRHELVQVAAMAVRAIGSIEGWRK